MVVQEAEFLVPMDKRILLQVLPGRPVKGEHNPPVDRVVPMEELQVLWVMGEMEEQPTAAVAEVAIMAAAEEVVNREEAAEVALVEAARLL